MRENMSGDPQMGMRMGGQPQMTQQSLPSVSHVMGPLPGQYRSSSSYASPQSSQPATPIHPSSMAPSPLAASPTPGPVRMVTIPQQNRSPLPMQNMQVSAPVAFVRPPDPTPLQTNPQMHVISSTQYPVADNDRIQPSTNGLSQKPQVEHMTPKEKYRQLKSRFKFLVYENECYQEELRNLQRKLLKLSRDKNFLLDRLQPYEMLSNSSDESDSNSVKTVEEKPKVPKKKARPAATRRRPPTQRIKPVSSVRQSVSRPNAPSSSYSVKVEELKTETDEVQQSAEQKSLNLVDQSAALNGSVGCKSELRSASSLTPMSNSDDVKRET